MSVGSSRKKEKREFDHLMGITTGKSTIKSHLSIIKRFDYRVCRACGEDDKALYHGVVADY